MENVIQGQMLKKGFKNFQLDIPRLCVPKGMATALIGENGAGKTTLLNMLAGIRLDYQGSICYFEECGAAMPANQADPDRHKSRIAYVGPGNYYLPHWNIQQIQEISELLFADFHSDRFRQWCEDLAIFSDNGFERKKKVSALSDGTRMKVMLAGVLSRDAKLLILDEPASPLDPLMRDKLCEMLQDYLAEGDGEWSVLFSTHNISDMENVTDYAIIMEHGQIVEQGFVENLKEKYIVVKGDAGDTERAKDILYSISANQYGFEGICLAENLDKFAGMQVAKEIPTLYQISVAVMKANSRMRMR